MSLVQHNRSDVVAIEPISSSGDVDSARILEGIRQQLCLDGVMDDSRREVQRKAKDVACAPGQGQAKAGLQADPKCDRPCTQAPQRPPDQGAVQSKDGVENGGNFIPLVNVEKFGWEEMDENGKPVAGSATEQISGSEFSTRLQGMLDSKDPVLQNRAQAYVQEYGLVQGKDVNGNCVWGILEPGQAQAVPASAANASCLNDIANACARSQWGIGAMGTGTGIGGLVGMCTVAPAAFSASAGGGAGMMGGAALAGMMGGSGIGAVVHGVEAGVTGLLGLEGASFNARVLMKSHMRDSRDTQMITMINNPGIPIEDLIFYFMAFMAQKYDEKLREKMEEAAVSERLQNERERTTRHAEMRAGQLTALGGIIGMAGGPAGAMSGLAIGQFIGGNIRNAAEAWNNIQSGLNGNIKSSTMLMAEVQMLMQKWKQMNEMLSNLMKALHEMAMVPIRNIR
jgi:hypothetical protein